MKSAIGIGALLMDGLGDTIRVSLTEDPEYEIEPCRRLADLGNKADSEVCVAALVCSQLFSFIHASSSVFFFFFQCATFCILLTVHFKIHIPLAWFACDECSAGVWSHLRS